MCLSPPSITIGIIVGRGAYTEQTDNYESYDVTINWSHPANGGSPITAYNMYVNGSTSPIVINASSTSTIINVLYDTTTTIIMKSQTVAGLSSNSNTLTFTV